MRYRCNDVVVGIVQKEGTDGSQGGDLRMPSRLVRVGVARPVAAQGVAHHSPPGQSRVPGSPPQPLHQQFFRAFASLHLLLLSVFSSSCLPRLLLHRLLFIPSFLLFFSFLLPSRSLSRPYSRLFPPPLTIYDVLLPASPFPYSDLG